MQAFYGYRQVGANRYRETHGLDFEQFEPGLVFHHRPGITISQQDNKNEALDTMNNAQLHYDQHYAGQTEWQQCLGVSTLTLQCLVGSSWKTFARKDQILRFDRIKMTAPVFDGATLYARSRILETGDHPGHPDLGRLQVETEGTNQDGRTVAQLIYHMLVYRKDHFPGGGRQGAEEQAVTETRFRSHRAMNGREYMEETGLYFEDLHPGEIFEHRPGKTVTAEENLRHCLRSLEWNPVYTDFHAIAGQGGRGHRVSEIYTLGLAAAASTRTFGRVVANLAWNDVVLEAPAFAGDTLYCESEIVSKRESKSRPSQGLLTAHTTARNQHGEPLLSFQRTFLLYKKGHGPYQAAGY